MEWIMDPSIWISLFTLTLLEIVLGIDNIVFISILAAKLPAEQQYKARQTGLLAALVTRVLLVLALAWLARLTRKLFTIPQMLWMEHPHEVSGRDIVLLVGGLFLLWQATREIHGKLEGFEEENKGKKGTTFKAVIIQIMFLDIVFSLDSVITAVGMVKHVPVMIAAVILAMGFMLVFSHAIADYIHKHPTLKMLALSFLMMVGFVLVAEGFHVEIPKGYIYFAMAFSVGVEILNIRTREKENAKRVQLNQKYH